MALIKPPNPRRRELRRNLPRHYLNRPDWLRGPAVIWASCYAVIFALGAHLLAPSVTHAPLYFEGQILRHAAVPRVEFTSINTVETDRLRDDAFKYQPAVYVPNPLFFKKVRTDLGDLVNLGVEESVQSLEQIPLERRKAQFLDEAAFRALRQTNQDPDALKAWNQVIDRFVVEQLPGIAVLKHKEFQEENKPGSAGIIIKPPAEAREMLRDRYSFYDIQGDESAIRKSVTTVLPREIPTALKRSVTQIVMDNITHQPTYQRDEPDTQLRRSVARDAIKPVETSYRPDSVMVPAGQRLTELDVALLEAEHLAYIRQLRLHAGGGPILFIDAVDLMGMGRLCILLLISGGLWTYILAYNPAVRRNPMRGFALTVLLLLCQAAAVYFTAYQPQFLLFTAIFPTLFAAMVLAITYDQRFALAMGMIHIAIVAVSLALSLEVAVIMLLGVAVTCTLLNEVRTRSKLVTTGAAAGLIMGAAAGLSGLTSGLLQFPDGWGQIGSNSFLAFWAGFGAGIFLQAILSYIEKLFHVTTAMTLKELNDATLPVLRRLAEDAPGTYRHSLAIADMAENAALAIDADGLLCRVGAMYHDIGKINKPSYFVENQGGGPNRHDKLSPAMSLLIIVGHVKDGVEMAREFGIPPIIRHFIESHHGTTLVEYFYHAAKQQTREDQDERVPTEFSFRYPGPKPETREAAILMLCDGIEGAARAMAEPTPVRLEQLVHTMANKRLMDGQFDECNLTLQELHRIEESIIKTLCSIYHGRIRYPEPREEQDSEGDSDKAEATSA